MAIQLLVTGFGPFPRVPRNPSGELARRLAAHPRLRLAGIEAHALVLTTAYGAIDDEFRPALAALRPDVVLMLGVAARRRALSIETRALNRVSRLFPDASGRVGRTLAFSSGAPLVLRPRLNTALIVSAARRVLAETHLSRDAGRYLCNASYFAGLEAGNPATLFVHLPMPRGGRPGDPRPSLLEMEAALLEIALVLTGRAQGPLTKSARKLGRSLQY